MEKDCEMTLLTLATVIEKLREVFPTVPAATQHLVLSVMGMVEQAMEASSSARRSMLHEMGEDWKADLIHVKLSLQS